jgi:hypothetical protein
MEDATAAIMINMIPLPNTPGLLNYTAPGYTNFRHTTIPSIKIDHSLSEKVKIAGYYSATQTNSPQTNGFPQAFTALQPQHDLAQTIRVNYDQTLTPTLLLHLGAGYMHTSHPLGAPVYNQTTNNLFPDGVPFPATYFPYLGGMYSVNGGGWSGGGPFPSVANTGVAFQLSPSEFDEKPTFNANLVWVKGNHTYKFGGTALLEGVIATNSSRAQGEFTFSAVQTSDPWQNGQPFANAASSGFAFASFYLGAANAVSTSRSPTCGWERILLAFTSRTAGK